jgi:hypothetical protein
MMWGGAPAQNIVFGTINIGGGGTTVVRDGGVFFETLAMPRTDRGAAIEACTRQRCDITLFDEMMATQRGDRAVPIEFGATSARDSLGPFASLATRRADPPVPAESLGTAQISITGDSTLPIEVLASQLSHRSTVIEDVATHRIDAVAPAEALAAAVRDGAGPVEWLASGVTIIANAAAELEWDGTSPSVVLSVETGPGRIRFLTTPGRVRLLRRN